MKYLFVGGPMDHYINDIDDEIRYFLCPAESMTIVENNAENNKLTKSIFKNHLYNKQIMATDKGQIALFIHESLTFHGAMIRIFNYYENM